MTQYIDFLSLGGSGEIGMNLNLYRYKDKWLMVDCGITFGDEAGIEILMPDITFIAQQRDKLVGIILTHAHEDHIGALPYLWEKLKAPLYATPFTAILIKDKLRQAGILDKVEIHTIPLGGSADIDPFSIEFISLTHSIPEANAIAIKTASGTIMHTGDWKFDENPLLGKESDINRLEELGKEGVLALVGDSTNAFVPGHTGSEATVRATLTDIIGQQSNRVFVTLFASNVARVKSCIEAATAHGRKVVLAGRSLHKMYDAAKQCGYLNDLPEVLDISQASALKKHEILYLCTGSQGESKATMSKIAYGSHPFLKAASDDCVIFSSREIPGNELAIYAIQNKLAAQGVNIVKDFDSTLHVSGHPSRDDLKSMFNLIKPQIAIPVHGEEQHMRAHAQLAIEANVPHVIVQTNGNIIRLNPDNPVTIDKVHYGVWCLDGAKVVPYKSNHIADRVKLSKNGAVFVTFYTDQNGALKKPMVTLLGLCEGNKETDHILKTIYKELEVVFKQIKPEEVVTPATIENLSQIAVRRATKLTCLKKPVVVTHVIS